MARYVKNPIVIEAIEYNPNMASFSETEFIRFLEGGRKWRQDDDGITIITLEGEMKASVGDFIIKGIKGELYPCKPDIFHETYTLVEKE